MPLTLLDRDITAMTTDAIVNAANVDLLMGSGVCGAIFRAAGAKEMQAACDSLSPIATGDAVITPGFALPARYVVHTAGPIYRNTQAAKCAEQLRSCYLNSLRLAEKNGCESIAFPLISAGIYGYPREEAICIAEESIREYLQERDMDVYLLIRDKATGLADKALMHRIREYVDSILPDREPNHHILQAMRSTRNTFFGKPRAAEKRPQREGSAADEAVPADACAAPAPGARLEDLIGNLDESFSETLLRLIDAKGRTDVDVYKRANLDRKLFSKIRTGKGYMPSKRTALALAVSLELNLRETEDLLSRAGFALSHSQKFDVIVEYFILNGIYDIYLINEALFQYDQPLLGG